MQLSQPQFAGVAQLVPQIADPTAREKIRVGTALYRPGDTADVVADKAARLAAAYDEAMR